jgi:hypothetical protein
VRESARAWTAPRGLASSVIQAGQTESDKSDKAQRCSERYGIAQVLRKTPDDAWVGLLKNEKHGEDDHPAAPALDASTSSPEASRALRSLAVNARRSRRQSVVDCGQIRRKLVRDAGDLHLVLVPLYCSSFELLLELRPDVRCSQLQLRPTRSGSGFCRRSLIVVRFLDGRCPPTSRSKELRDHVALKQPHRGHTLPVEHRSPVTTYEANRMQSPTPVGFATPLHASRRGDTNSPHVDRPIDRPRFRCYAYVSWTDARNDSSSPNERGSLTRKIPQLAGSAAQVRSSDAEKPPRLERLLEYCVVARDGLEPPTRGFSVCREALVSAPIDRQYDAFRTPMLASPRLVAG